MSGRRAAVGVLTVLTALLLQVAVVSRLPLPGSPPDLLLVVVLAFALAEGPLSGMVTGFAAGLLADLTADHALGRLALAYVLAGHVVGLLAGDRDRSVLRPLLAVGVGAATSLLVYAGEGLVLGDVRVTGDALGQALVSAVPYAVVLVPFVVPLVGRLVAPPDRVVLGGRAR